MNQSIGRLNHSHHPAPGGGSYSQASAEARGHKSGNDPRWFGSTISWPRSVRIRLSQERLRGLQKQGTMSEVARKGSTQTRYVSANHTLIRSIQWSKGNASSNRSINASIHSSTIKSINQSINQSTNEPGKNTLNQSTSRKLNQTPHKPDPNPLDYTSTRLY